MSDINHLLARGAEWCVIVQAIGWPALFLILWLRDRRDDAILRKIERDNERVNRGRGKR